MEAADNKELFESQWRQAFEGVSVSPPPMVWERIEAKLATQKESKYKKAIFYYRWAAAAMTTVAVGLGTVLLFQSPETEVVITSAPVIAENQQAETTSGTLEPTHGTQVADLTSAAGQVAGNVTQKDQNNNIAGSPVVAAEGLLAASNEKDEETATVMHTADGSMGQLAELSTERPSAMAAVAAIRSTGNLESNLTVVKVDHLYGVARPVLVGRRSAPENRPLVAGLGLGGGTFNPNYGFRSAGNLFSMAGANSEGAITSSDVASQKDNGFNYATGLTPGNARAYPDPAEQGNSFAFGANVGKRIFRRLVLHTGVQYGRYNSGARSSVVVQDEANNRKFIVNQVSVGSDDVQEVLSSGQYSYADESPAVTNTYEFISVPVKLGVVLLDRRAGIVLNTGISNEFLLSNLIRAREDGYEQVKTRPGEESPYRNMYLNGTLGLEVNYAITNHYRIVVEPYYRHALTALTKNTEGYSSSPRLWGIQAGVRYELR